MPITVAPLVYRIEKGAPVSVLEEDTNLKTLRNAINGLGALWGISFNDDGTLKVLPDRFVQQRNLVFPFDFYGVDTGGPNALAIAFVPPLAGGYVAGQKFQVKLANPITGPATLNVDAAGAVAIKKQGNVDLATGDGIVGQVLEVVHNGVDFQLINTFGAVLSFVNGAVSNGAGADTFTVLGAGDTQIGTHQLALPAGKRWTWVRHVFTAFLTNAASQRGIAQFKVKVSADIMAWVDNLATIGEYQVGNTDDASQIVYMAEGAPVGHETDANLQINTFARQSAAGFGDSPVSRKMYTVAYWQ